MILGKFDVYNDQQRLTELNLFDIKKKKNFEKILENFSNFFLLENFIFQFVFFTGAMILGKFDVYNDQQRLTESGYDVGMLLIYLFMCCVPLTLCIGGVAWGCVVGVGSAANSVATRCVNG